MQIIVIAIVLARYGCSSNKMFSKWNLLRHEAVQGVEFRFTALDDGKAYERSSGQFAATIQSHSQCPSELENVRLDHRSVFPS